MAEIGEVRISRGKVLSQLTVRLKVDWPIGFWWRTEMGVWLIRLAQWVSGVPIEVSPPPPERPGASLALPPTRLCVDDLIRGYLSWDEARHLHCLLNGQEMRQVVAYDCEEGWIECVQRNEAGDLIIIDEAIQHERHTGEVSVFYKRAVADE